MRLFDPICLEPMDCLLGLREVLFASSFQEVDDVDRNA